MNFLKRLLCVLAVLSLLPLASLASGTAAIGTATITNRNRVNVREGGGLEYAVISSVAPGESFPCLSVAPSGWYEILLPDGRRGFISNNLARLDYGVQQYGATVPVYYRTADGKLLYTDHYRLNQGVNQIYANSAFVPQGYVLQSTQPVTVSNNNGVVTPAAVLFIYTGAGAQPGQPSQPVSGTARVTIEYKDIYGTVLSTEYADLAPGSRTVYANAALLPDGYTLVGAKDAVVSVSSGLSASPSTLVFLAVRAQNQTPPPQNVTIAVHYQTTGGAWLYTDYVRLNAGYNTVTANDGRVPAGYTLYSGRSTTVYVSNAGVASPSAVTFLYSQNAPQVSSSTVPVYYRSANGQTLATDYARVKAGNNTIYANDAKVPGYTLQSSRTVSVYLAGNGVATPSSVVFTYAVPVSASVQVIYQDNAGQQLFSEWMQMGLGTHTLYANSARVPYGYRLTSAASVSVHVDASGAVRPARVVFEYAPPAPQPPQPTAAPAPNPPAPSGGNYIMPMYAKASISGAYDVYTGPGTGYYRVGNAAVGGGVCRWYGTEGDWVLMGYQYTKGGYRLGYIPRAGIPDGVNVQELHFMYEPVTVISAASLTDDPVIDPTWLFKVPEGTTVKLLGFLPDNDHWAYIETEYAGEPVRGFINRVRIGR